MPPEEDRERVTGNMYMNKNLVKVGHVDLEISVPIDTQTCQTTATELLESHHWKFHRLLYLSNISADRLNGCWFSIC